MHHNLQRLLHTDSFQKKKQENMIYLVQNKKYMLYSCTKMFNLNANLEEQINFATTYDSNKRSKFGADGCGYHVYGHMHYSYSVTPIPKQIFL